MPSSERPNPLADAASKVGVAVAAASGVVSALVAFGLLTSIQGEAVQTFGNAAPDTITALGTVIAGIFPLISAVIASFRTAAAARDHVTPSLDPRGLDAAGNLVPLVPVTATSRHPIHFTATSMSPPSDQKYMS